MQRGLECTVDATPRFADYEHYGGRGIGVCKEWRDSYSNFLESMGRRPSDAHSLDRKDVNADYSADNCRWATREEQQRNRRNNRWLTFLGTSKTVAAWAEEMGVPVQLFYDRLRKGWSDEDTITKRRRERRSKNG